MHSQEHWTLALTRLADLFGPVGGGLRFPGHLRPEPAAARLPVLRHLAPALAGAEAQTRKACEAVSALADALCWRQNPSYTDPHFLAGYAYCELLGPTGHLPHDTIAAGLLLLQPDIVYPAHAHPAVEHYLVLSGRAQWRQGAGDWRTRVAGERITHASMEAHAMRTTTEPLLAAYLWQGDLTQGARLVEATQA